MEKRVAKIYGEDFSEVKRRAPWATKVVKFCGVFLAFESLTDYRTWFKNWSMCK